jgi:hypothetical protein
MRRAERAFRVFVFLLTVNAATAVFGADALPGVLNGIDVLRQQKFAPLTGKRVGLVTNHTGVGADGTSTIDILFKSGVCKLVALFSPEHGIRGTAETNVSSSVDEQTVFPSTAFMGIPEGRRWRASGKSKFWFTTFRISGLVSIPTPQRSPIVWKRRRKPGYRFMFWIVPTRLGGSRSKARCWMPIRHRLSGICRFLCAMA